MIRQGHGAITDNSRTSDELGGNQFSIAVKGVGMQIDQGILLFRNVDKPFNDDQLRTSDFSLNILLTGGQYSSDVLLKLTISRSSSNGKVLHFSGIVQSYFSRKRVKSENSRSLPDKGSVAALRHRSVCHDLRPSHGKDSPVDGPHDQ